MPAVSYAFISISATEEPVITAVRQGSTTVSTNYVVPDGVRDVIPKEIRFT